MPFQGMMAFTLDFLQAPSPVTWDIRRPCSRLLRCGPC